MKDGRFKQLIENLPPLIDSGTKSKEWEWASRRAAFRKQVAKNPVSSFTKWSVIQATMFVGSAPYIEAELDYVRGFPDIFHAAVDPLIGEPETLPYDPLRSGNIVHQAFHLALLKHDFPKFDVRQMAHIVEVGAGYGTMPYLISKMGFRGIYHLVDLPEFLILQRYYLEACLPWELPPGIEGASPLISTAAPKFNYLKDGCKEKNPDLLIALFSLSEMSETQRRLAIDPNIRSEYYLLAYSPQWGDTNNDKWFDDFQRARPETEWKKFVRQYPYYVYLLGGPKNG